MDAVAAVVPVVPRAAVAPVIAVAKRLQYQHGGDGGGGPTLLFQLSSIPQ